MNNMGEKRSNGVHHIPVDILDEIAARLDIKSLEFVIISKLVNLPSPPQSIVTQFKLLDMASATPSFVLVLGFHIGDLQRSIYNNIHLLFCFVLTN